MAIAKTVMSTDHKTQKESYTRSCVLFFAFKMSVAEQFYSIAALVRDEKCARESVCVCAGACVRACVRTYVRVVVT